MPYGDLTGLMYGVPGMMEQLGGGAGALWGGMKSGAGAAGNWAQSNPLDALTLGAGAAGTGFGVWDIIRANQAANQRNFLANHWLRQHPAGSYMPDLTDAVRAQMMRPTAANLGTAGIDPTSGAWRGAIADSMNNQYSALYGQAEQQRLADYQAKLAGLGMAQPSVGSVAGLPQALQWLQISRALRQQPQSQVPPNAAMTTNLPNMQLDNPLGGLTDQLKTQWPEDTTGASSFYPTDYTSQAY